MDKLKEIIEKVEEQIGPDGKGLVSDDILFSIEEMIEAEKLNLKNIKDRLTNKTEQI